MIDLSTLVAAISRQLGASIVSRFKGQGLAQMVAGILVVPLVGLIYTHVVPWIQWKFDDYVFPTAYMNPHDEAAEWVMAWIAQDPQAQKQMHHFWISASDKQVVKKSKNILMSKGDTHTTSERASARGATWATERIVGKISPLHGQTIYINHNGSRLWIKRTKVHTLKIRTYIFQRHALKEFLIAAHDAMHAHEEHTIHIFNPQRLNANWSHPLPRPSRPWSSVILPGTLKDDLFHDIQKFFSEKEVRWYSSRGIPHRRGYLLHGTPGAGKTTLIQIPAIALASRLRLDIYAINPGQSGMDDARLNKLFRDVPRRSIILIEDIDCIFMQHLNRSQVNTRTVVIMDNTSAQEAEEEEEDGGKAGKDGSKRKTKKTVVPTPEQAGAVHGVGSSVTLSGLLNAIDGVSSQEGCIIIASTNHIEHLDPALYRPGQFDIKIPFQNATPDQARSLFHQFFPLEDLLQRDVSDIKTNAASEHINDPEEKLADPYNPFRTNIDHIPVAVTSQEEVNRLADQFVTAISQRRALTPDVPLSMAHLQGYLLRYKDDPTAAAKHAAEWTTSEAAQDWQGQASSLSAMQIDDIPLPIKKAKKRVIVNGEVATQTEEE